MASEFSKTQIDRLGDRLKKEKLEEADLRLLDLYRRSFTKAFDLVVGKIRSKLALHPTGRPAKSTPSITEKLRRESFRLTQVQDIAGCRIVVEDIAAQDQVVQSLTQLFEHTKVIDRREQPSHGYRAVHVLVNIQNKLIEVQVRTALQHLWAELSEKYSDKVDPTIKYGGGSEEIVWILSSVSKLVAEHEQLEAKIGLLEEAAHSNTQPQLSPENLAVVEKELSEIQATLVELKERVVHILHSLLNQFNFNDNDEGE